jgi:hypothetical protein
MTDTLRPTYTPAYRSSTDAFLAADFLAVECRFDFDREVQSWLRGAAAAGRAEVRPLSDGPGAASAWHLRSRSGHWRALAIRYQRDCSAYSRLLGRKLVACAA